MTSASTARKTLGLLLNDEPELGQHAADLVDAAGAVFLEPLAHPVQAHHALLLASLDRHEAHARRDAASQIAAASVASFLPLLPSMR